MSHTGDRIARPAHAYRVAPSALDIFTDEGPTAFHQRLRDMLRHARRRIVLASLYFGTDERERELVDDLHVALARSPELRVQIVLDYSRARRRTRNGTSVTFLAGLLRDHGDRVQLHLHQMPQLAGLLAHLPSPLDECIAVCHVKTLLADDLAILTGANLSDEYFHCRQARYIAVADAGFADLSEAIVDVTARHSVRVRVDGDRVVYQPGRHPATNLCRALDRLMARFAVDGRPAERPGDRDTWLEPVFQHPALGVQQERRLLCRMFSETDGELVIHTPYPNFPDDYVRALARRLAAGRGRRTSIVCPSDNCHGFSTGRGLKALVPSVYLRREREIAEALERAARSAGAAGVLPELIHYQRRGWVFHSKGVWLDTPERSASVIGSSSYGERSVTRDFDLSYLLVTRDQDLRHGLQRELDTVLEHTRPDAPVSRPGSFAAPLLAPLVKPFL